MIINQIIQLHSLYFHRYFRMGYTFNVLSLFFRLKITFLTALCAIKSRPVIVAGRRGGYVVDQDFK